MKIRLIRQMIAFCEIEVDATTKEEAENIVNATIDAQGCVPELVSNFYNHQWVIYEDSVNIEKEEK